MRIDFDAISSNIPHFLGVGDVKNFPTELEFMVFPRQFKSFAQSHIKHPIAWAAKNVAFSGFARICIAKTAIGFQGVASE